MHFGTDMPRGRPRKNFGLKNFGLIFRSLINSLLWLQDDGKGGLGLRGGAFMTVLAVLTVLVALESPFTLLLLALQNTVPRDVTVLAVLAVVAVLVVAAAPLNRSELKVTELR